MNDPDLFEGVLFTPPGKTTRIQKKDFPMICEYLKPGDRIAWHRPYMLIHEATVLHVSQYSGKILVAEVHKENLLGGILEFKEIKLGSQFGELYRYDYDRELAEDEKIIKELVSQLGNYFSYNFFASNCQHMTERTHSGRQGSYQTRWFFSSKVLIESLPKLLPELFEYYYNAKNELIGLVGTVVLHVVTFLTKFAVAYRKLKGGRITWVHFTTLIFKEIVMSLGDIVVQYVAYRFEITSPTSSYHDFLGAYVAFVLACMGACILDALLLWCGVVSSDSSWRYVINGVGAALGLGSVFGLSSTGWVLEFLFSAVLGFTAQLVAHGLYHAGNWLYSWLKGEGVDSRLVNDINELKEGDHITNYEHWYHSCHGIFVRVLDQQRIRVIKNTYSEGVVEKDIPFRKGNVYKYVYNSSESRPDSEVLEVARSKIGGPNTYSCFTNNCKTFAKKCKCVGNGSGAPSRMNTALEGVNVMPIIDELLADEDLGKVKRKIYTSLKLSIIGCP